MAIQQLFLSLFQVFALPVLIDIIKEENIIKDLLYLAFVFLPVFLMAITLTRSIKKATSNSKCSIAMKLNATDTHSIHDLQKEKSLQTKTFTKNTSPLRKKSILIGILGFILIFAGIIGIAIAENVWNLLFPKNQMVKPTTIQTFDEMYQKISKDIHKQFLENIDYLVSRNVNDIEKEYAKAGIKLTPMEKNKLQSIMNRVFYTIDYGAYFRKQKQVFLKKVGKTENEINRMINSKQTKEQILQLNKRFKRASFELGVEMYQDPIIEKQFLNALDEFNIWRKKQQNKSQSND